VTTDGAAPSLAHAAHHRSSPRPRFESLRWELVRRAPLLEVDVRSEPIARRELYRRCLRIGEMVIDVTVRVTYEVVKQT